MALSPKTVKIATLTILSAATTSNAIESGAFANFSSISIVAPSALTGTVSMQQGDDYPVANYRTVQSPSGTDVVIAQNKSLTLNSLPFPAIRLISSGAEAADRFFTVWGHRNTNSIA